MGPAADRARSHSALYPYRDAAPARQFASRRYQPKSGVSATGAFPELARFALEPTLVSTRLLYDWREKPAACEEGVDRGGQRAKPEARPGPPTIPRLCSILDRPRRGGARLGAATSPGSDPPRHSASGHHGHGGSLSAESE